MYKIDTGNAATSLPTPLGVGSNPNGFFQHGDSEGETTSDIPTQVSHDFLNAIQEEISYVITQADIALDKNDRTQLYDAINAMAEGVEGDPGILMGVEDDISPGLGGDLQIVGHKIIAQSAQAIELSASNAVDLNNSAILTHTDIQHRADINNKIAFGTDIQEFSANGLIIAGISTLGFELGNTGAIINSILNDATLVADSSTDLCTQQAYVTYANSVADFQEVYTIYYWFDQAYVINSNGSGLFNFGKEDYVYPTFSPSLSVTPATPDKVYRIVEAGLWTNTTPNVGSGSFYTFGIIPMAQISGGGGSLLNGTGPQITPGNYGASVTTDPGTELLISPGDDSPYIALCPVFYPGTATVKPTRVMARITVARHS